MAGDGKSAYERLKRRQHREALLPFRTAVRFRVAGKVPGGVMTDRRHLNTWLGKRFQTEEHIVARKGESFVIRSRAVKALPEETTSDDLDAIKGSPWAPSGVMRDVLPDVSRPILSWDEPFLLVEERPVPRNMNISQDILRKFGYTPGCAKCRKLSHNEYSHTGLAHSQDCRTRVEAASRTDPVCRDRDERAEKRKIDFYAKEVERMDHPRRASLEPSVVPGPPTEEKEGEDRSSARDVKRARGQPEQDLSGEIPIPSADETRATEKIPCSENIRVSLWSYDMAGHAKKCVERCCESANRTTQQLYKVIYSMH